MNNYFVPNLDAPFSFKYGDNYFADIISEFDLVSTKEKIDDITKIENIYTHTDGFSVKLIAKIYSKYNAVDWAVYFENKGNKKTKQISEINTTYTTIKFKKDKPTLPGFFPTEDVTYIYTSEGTDHKISDFIEYRVPMLVDEPKSFRCKGGRSSSFQMPYFNLVQKDSCTIFALGWTGQWQAGFSRVDDGIEIKAGLKNHDFYLKPNESYRLPSTLMLNCKNGKIKSHNMFRRLLLEYYVPKDEKNKPIRLPFSNSSWGGMRTDEHLQKLRELSKRDLGYEYYWIDAGWYGESDGYSPSEFVGDWGTQVGNWNENKKAHPDGLKPIADRVKADGMKFLLWIEPERTALKAPVAKEHPDWLLMLDDRTEPEDYVLVNLGHPDALDWVINTVSEKIETLGIDCYRQDYNIDPLPFWLKTDTDDRKGISELKYINGLYKFWDTLHRKYPNLIIDNCASGGRRIDIETTKRSVPLWRNDYQCWWNFNPTGSQIQTYSLANLPLSATGNGYKIGDTYNARSNYSAGYQQNFWAYAHNEFDESHPWEWNRKINAEYKMVRDYYYGDFYPLTTCNADEGTWMAWQFDRPKNKDGMIQVFRRPKSPFYNAIFELGGIKANRKYQFTDIDTDEKKIIDGKTLTEKGYEVIINNPRESKIILYEILD